MMIPVDCRDEAEAGFVDFVCWWTTQVVSRTRADVDVGGWLVKTRSSSCALEDDPMHGLKWGG